MTEKINHLKKLRIARGLTQQEICLKLKMSRSTYSKIENGLRLPSLSDLQIILDTLGLRFVDYVKEIESTDSFSKYFSIYFMAFTGQNVLNSTIQDLDRYVELTKSRNTRSLTLFALVKYMLQPKYPRLISKPQKEDEYLITQALKNISKPLAFYDIKLIANFGAKFLLPEEQSTYLRPLIPFSPYDYLEYNADYSLEVNKLYNNFCDMAITHGYYDWAEELLTYHDEFTKVYKNFRYIHYKNVNKETLKYVLTKEQSCIANIRLIASYFDIIEDYATANLIRKQANQLKDTTYISGEDIARDR